MAPLQLNTNVPPYHDDFDPLKNYYKVLYKPGYPVQARELTSTQSILQDQIEQLASRILATGDQVVGGEFGFDNKVPYVRVSSITQGAQASDFVGYILEGEVSGVKAKVMFAYPQVKDEEGRVTEDVTFQVQYLDAGVKAVDSTFREGEVLTSSNPSAYTAVCGIDTVSRPIDTKPMGFGCNFTVQSGSYFVDGFMVRNDEETIVISKYNRNPTCQIGFLVNESFVTSNDDPSLLDNSQGSSNFAAPGADRLQITMQLAQKALDAKEPNFIGLVDVVKGNLQGKPDQSVKWAWLYDLLAQRTNEEEGDYIIRDFSIKRLEYVNSKNVDGLFDADENGNYPAIPGSEAAEAGETLTLQEAQAIYVLEVSAGKAMVQGYQVGYTQSVYLYGNKPRSPELSPDSFTYISPGASFTLQNTSGSPDLQNITGDGNAVAFTPILMYKQFLDGFIGVATEQITYPDGTVVDAPINRNKRPLDTYHIIADGEIGQTQFAEIYNSGNTCVVVSNVAINRGDVIGNAIVLVSTPVIATPTGYMNPRYFEPRQVVNEQTGYEAFATTYDLGILTSTFFTELIAFEDINAESEWEVGSRIIGEVSAATGIIEGVNTINNATILIVSNIVGEFINGEVIEQPQTNKSAVLIRPGEVLGFDFYDKGETQTVSLDSETGVEVSALGATTTLDLAAGDITITANKISLTQQGRDKLIRFPYAVDVDRNAVKVNLTAKTIPSGVNGYGVVLPAYVTHTLQKTKSLFSGLNDVNNFSSDISIQNASDAEYLSVADGSLFSGEVGYNWVTCDNFSGDASDQLVGGDIVTLAADDASVVTKVVKFVTAPAGSGQFRDKCFIYFTTAVEKPITGKVVQRVRIKTSGDVQQGVVYRLPEQYVKSLESNPLKTGIDYQVGRQFYQNVEAGATEVTLVTNRTNETFITNERTSVSIARNLSSPSDPYGLLGRLVSISAIDIQDNGRKIVISFTEPLDVSATLKVVTSIFVTNALAKKKIIRRDVKVRIPYPESAGTVLSLGKADIFQVNYIKSVSTGNFITNNYELDDGQRQNIYDIGRIILKEGAPRITQSSDLNESGTIEVSFDYLEHSDAGDFFSVDSYTHEDGINYTVIPYYPFQSQGAAEPTRQNLILNTPLRDCIDFRPVVNTAMPYASVIAQITPGTTAYESHNFRDSTNLGDGFAPRMPLANSQFRSDIEFYVGKIDTLFLDKSGQLVLQEGEQTENPIRPSDLATGLRLYDLRIQPFCMHAKTNIKLKKYDYFRYGMKEIYGLDKRIARLEDVVTLSLLEQKTLNMTVKDAVTGLDRFKSGYIVDGFNDHSRGDVQSPYYRCAIDPKRSMLRPPFFKDQVELEEVYMTDEGRNVNGNYVNNNGICTAPFTPSVYAENPVATRWINVQVYNVFTWQGQLNLNPSVDTFTDIRTLPDLNIEDNSLYDAMTALTTGLYELGILGTVWETNQTLIDEYVDWNTEEHADLEARLAELSDAFTERDVTQEEILPPRTIGGGAGLEIQTQIFGTNITATGDIQVQKDLRLEGGEVIETSYGDRITDITLVRSMRSIPVFFTVSNVKPNTQFYAFFDGIPVSRWVSPDNAETDYADGLSTNLMTPNSNPKGFGQPIISCDRGRISGVFLIPNGRPPLREITTTTTDPDTGIETTTTVPQVFDGYMQHVQYETSGTTRSFPTGDRKLRFTTEVSNRDSTVEDSDLVDSYAEATFTGSGIIADKQNTVVSTKTVEFIPQREELQRIINEIVEVQEIQRTFVRFPIRRDDPVAQTFEVDANHENGIFVTELEAYFRTKDDTVPIEAYLLPTEGHVPIHNIIPMSRVSVDPDSIIRVQCTLENDSETIGAGMTVVGQTSGATGVVKSAVVFESAEDNPEQNCTNYVYNVVLDNYLGEFIPGEQIIPSFVPESLSSYFIVQDEYRVTRVDVTNFGEDYEDATIEFDQPELPGGVAATAVAKVANGKVYNIEVTSPGSGYINVPAVSILSDTGNGATCTARVVDGRVAVDMGVATSEDGTAGTKFKFEAPIYLLGQQVYAFVLFSPSLEYRAYTSKIGENELATNVRVVEQPHLGSLFKSQNNGIWTEEQSQDIKFKLHKADFFTNTSSKIQLKNQPITTQNINRDPIETNANAGTDGSQIFGDNPKIVTVYHDWNGLVAGDTVEIFGVTGNPGGIDNAILNSLHTVVASDFRKFTIEVSTPATITEKAGGNDVFCSYNRPFEAATLKTGIIQPAGTNLTATMRTVGAETPDGYGAETSYTRDTPVQITPENRFYFSEPKQVASAVNEVLYNDTFHLRGEPSLKVTANLTTQNVDLSPVIDLSRTGVWTERNLVDNPSTDNIIFGLTPKTVTFDTAFAADLLTDDEEITFTAIDGNDYTVRVQEFNPNTGRVVLAGKNIDHFNKSSVFAKAELNTMGITRISQQNPLNFVPETKNFGTIFAKWMSRQFDLQNECDGVEIRMSAVFYNPEDIKIYYKPRAVGFDGDFDTLSWIPFNADQPAPGEAEVDPNTGDLVATPGLCDNVGEINLRSRNIASPEILKNTDLFEMRWTLQDVAKFDAIAFKIIMTATNPAKCPLIDDIRVVCSE
jgi:hypothetical protein